MQITVKFDQYEIPCLRCKVFYSNNFESNNRRQNMSDVEMKIISANENQDDL